MPRTVSLEELRAWLASGVDPRTGLPLKCWPFGDGPGLAAELLDLVLRGRKTATADLLWHYEDAGEEPPRPGQLSIVTTWDGEPRALIETTEAPVVPYDRVTADFARAEGEGDLSLAYWRRVHWDYYTRQLAGTPRAPSRDMPVVCERFRLLRAIPPGAMERLPRRG